MSVEPPLLAFDRVSRSFDNGRVVALRDVSLQIAIGECVAIVGRSGSGKSCLLNLASGIDEPDSGRVLWRGELVASRRAWAALRLRDIGIVFQEFHLIPTLTAAQNVELPLLGDRLRHAERRPRVAKALADLGLQSREGHLPHELSGGERQRVAIARALVRQPRLLLADEPTGSLDSATAGAIADLLLGLWRNQGMTLLVVTHDEELAARCSRIVRLHDGAVVSDTRAACNPAADQSQ